MVLAAANIGFLRQVLRSCVAWCVAQLIPRSRVDNNPSNDFNLPDGTLLTSAGGQAAPNAAKMAQAWKYALLIFRCRPHFTLRFRVADADSLFTLREAHFQKLAAEQPQNDGAELTPMAAANGDTALVAKAFSLCQKVMHTSGQRHFLIILRFQGCSSRSACLHGGLHQRIQSGGN